jgi:hypothetical protein
MMGLPVLGSAVSSNNLMALHVLALLVLGLMCGSELNVAAFGHPILNRQSLDVHIAVRRPWRGCSVVSCLFG